MVRLFSFSLAALAVSSLFALEGRVQKSGAERIVVSIETADNGPAAKAFNRSLRRNLGLARTVRSR